MYDNDMRGERIKIVGIVPYMDGPYTKIKESLPFCFQEVHIKFNP